MSTTTVDDLAQALADAEADRGHADAALDTFMGTLEEKLESVDGREALHELSADDAAAERGELLSKRDGLKAEAARTKGACTHIAERLLAAVREAAEAKLVEPREDYRRTVVERDEMLRLLEKREQAIVAARGVYRQAEAEGLALIVAHDPVERARHADNERRKSEAIAWARKQPGLSGVRQLSPAWQAEATEAVEKADREAEERQRKVETERAYPQVAR